MAALEARGYGLRALRMLRGTVMERIGRSEGGSSSARRHAAVGEEKKS